ncbi:MAG: type III secretion system outer membrane ring subunit SctC [Janthinobacterium lividum]
MGGGETGNRAANGASAAPEREAGNTPNGGGVRRASAPGSALVQQQPVIQADSRINSVIIRDRPERMPIYRELINLLDVPSQLVEIEAMIVDVNSSEIHQLGIDWGARAGRVSANVTAGGAISDAATAATLSIGGSSTVIADAANFLMTRINALESRGAARIMSRPSILTMDNLGALIDLSETFYIQSVGERVSNVTPVSVGTTLKVTPHVVDENNQRWIQLVVDIEDGAIQDRLIQTLPTVRRSVIGTQAMMGERESLLIGGFNAERTIRQKDGIPVLGNLPFFGPLFSKTDRTVEKSERLFVITPKIISLDGQVAQAGALRQGPAATMNLPARLNTVPAGRQAAPTPSRLEQGPARPYAVPAPQVPAQAMPAPVRALRSTELPLSSPQPGSPVSALPGPRPASPVSSLPAPQPGSPVSALPEPQPATPFSSVPALPAASLSSGPRGTLPAPQPDGPPVDEQPLLR